MMTNNIWEEKRNIMRLIQEGIDGRTINLPNGGMLMPISDEDVPETILDIYEGLFDAYHEPSNANICGACGLQPFSKTFIIDEIEACIACAATWLMCQERDINIEWPPPNQAMFDHLLDAMERKENEKY